MKKSKKLFALALALMVTFSTLVTPAMAAGEDEEIMPLYEVKDCGNCGEAVRFREETLELYSGFDETYVCITCKSTHKSKIMNVYKQTVCPACGFESGYSLVYRYYNGSCQGVSV